MNAWFISDLHLKDPKERNSQTLLRFLLSLESGERPATHLFLLGDIFDLWVGPSNFFYQQFQDIVDVLARLNSNGVEVYYFEGNHDFHVDQFWKRHGISVVFDELQLKLDRWQVRLEHGDFINPNDTAYLRYREFIRGFWIRSLAHILPGRWIHWIGNKASQKSRKHSSVYRQDKEQWLRRMIRDYAESQYERSLKHKLPFDFIITGHMHIKDSYEFIRDEKTVRSINLGSWFDGAKAGLLDVHGFQFVQL